MIVAGLFIAVIAGDSALSPAQVIDEALNAAEPPPSLRAAFRATISSQRGVRQISFDPFLPERHRFQIRASFGDDPELDRIVADWRAEHQPDIRLFADDLRESVGAGRVMHDGQAWRISFEHRLSSNDGPIDAAVSQNMLGAISIDDASGQLESLTYKIRAPFRAPDGSTVLDYTQTYDFGRSQQWGVTFISGYELTATGGRFGVRGSRFFKVAVTDVAFSLANDARIEMDSKPYVKRRSEAG